jgi:hypothetical protein
MITEREDWEPFDSGRTLGSLGSESGVILLGAPFPRVLRFAPG